METKATIQTWFTTAEAAEYLRKLRGQCLGPRFSRANGKPNGAIRYKRDELDHWLDAAKVG
jgi:hypothetical protein